MLPEFKTKTNIGVGAGLLLQMAGNLMSNPGEPLTLVAGLLFLLGTALFIWGCSMYAKAKGHSPVLGLLGLLWILGLVILFLLKDKNK